MEVRSWIFEYADDVNIVELEHDPETGYRTIKVNGLITVEDERENLHGGVYKFKVGELPCMLYIRYKKQQYQYDFFTLKPEKGLATS